ncbi:MAG: OsmC family protein, partial [Burkholderiales bacterium]|nr:OsmC family protein [Burkholderiales bacterium]
LALAAKQKLRVDRYLDRPWGVMEKNAEGRLAMTQVTLRPQVVFSAEAPPARAVIDDLHHRAHDACFIANSVKTDIRCEPVYG